MSTRNPRGDRVLARIHCHVGDWAMALLPDGQLVPARRASSSPAAKSSSPRIVSPSRAARGGEEFPGFKSKQDDHVYIYDTSEEFALATSRILETMLPGVALHGKAQQIACSSPIPKPRWWW